MAGSQQAFVTLATNDTYAVGALVWANSLKNVGTTRQLAILITAGVSQSMRDTLGQTFDNVRLVEVLDSEDRENLELLTRRDLGVTFTKLHCWRLTEYSKAVFMDADTLVIQNIDDLFEREEFSASPDPGWPDCFNSGVFVYRPSEETYQSLLQFALTQGSFDGGDQGLLNLYFSDWATKDIARHLPFVYNCVSMAFYSYLPAFKQFGKNVKVAHFIGAQKPWHHTYNPNTGGVEGSEPGTGHAQEFLQAWWKVFLEKVQPSIQSSLMPQEFQTTTTSAQGGLATDFGNLKISSTGTLVPAAAVYDDPGRQYRWEQGQIDYLGVDSFDHIKAKLDQSMKEAAESEEEKAPAPAPAKAPAEVPAAVPAAAKKTTSS